MRVFNTDLGALSLLQHLLKLLVVFVVWIGSGQTSGSGHEVRRQLSDGRPCALEPQHTECSHLQEVVVISPTPAACN